MNFSEFQYLIIGNFKETFIRSNPPCSEALKINSDLMMNTFASPGVLKKTF